MIHRSDSSAKNIAFVLASLSLSGGTSIILEAIRNFPKNVRVTLLLPDPSALRFGNDYVKNLKELNLGVSYLSQENLKYDVLVMTFWATVPMVLNSNVEAKRFEFFVQSLEDRFTANPQNPNFQEICSVQKVYGIDIPIVTEANWIKNSLDNRPNCNEVARLVPNPIILEYFNVKPKSEFGGVNSSRLIITIEGHDAWFKGVGESLRAISLVNDVNLDVHLVGDTHSIPKLPDNINLIIHKKMTRENFQKILSESDLILKMSHVEGMYGPPLEAFSLGTTCITSRVTGSEEFIEHLQNSIVVEIGDIYGVAHWIRILNSNRELLSELNTRALTTAKKWNRNQKNNLFYSTIIKKYSKSLPTQTLSSKLPKIQKWNSISPTGINLSSPQNDLKIVLRLGLRLLRKGRLITLYRKIRRFYLKHYASKY